MATTTEPRKLRAEAVALLRRHAELILADPHGDRGDAGYSQGMADRIERTAMPVEADYVHGLRSRVAELEAAAEPRESTDAEMVCPRCEEPAGICDCDSAASYGLGSPGLGSARDALVVADVLRTFAEDCLDQYAPVMQRVADRLDPKLAPAREALGRDEFIDADGPSVHLHPDVADALLTARGWTIRRWGTDEPIRPGLDADHAAEITGKPHSFISPDSERYWHRSEALTLALTAEGLADA